MSEIRGIIRTKLIANTTLSALVGNTTLDGAATTEKSIFYDHLPDSSGVVYPAIVCWQVSGNDKPVNAPRIDESRWQFDIEASSLTIVEAMKKLIIDTLNKWTYSDTSYSIYKSVYDGSQKPEYDNDRDLWSVSIDFIFGFQIK
jgi:hypothetical protein